MGRIEINLVYMYCHCRNLWHICLHRLNYIFTVNAVILAKARNRVLVHNHHLVKVAFMRLVAGG